MGQVPSLKLFRGPHVFAGTSHLLCADFNILQNRKFPRTTISLLALNKKNACKYIVQSIKDNLKQLWKSTAFPVVSELFYLFYLGRSLEWCSAFLVVHVSLLFHNCLFLLAVRC